MSRLITELNRKSECSVFTRKAHCRSNSPSMASHLLLPFLFVFLYSHQTIATTCIIKILVSIIQQCYTSLPLFLPVTIQHFPIKQKWKAERITPFSSTERHASMSTFCFGLVWYHPIQTIWICIALILIQWYSYSRQQRLSTNNAGIDWRNVGRNKQWQRGVYAFFFFYRIR